MSTTCPEPSLSRPGSRNAQALGADLREGGFTLVSVIFILVVLAALGAALAKMSMRQHMGAASDLAAARAYQAANAGLEWATFQVLRNPAPPAAAPACFGNTNIALGGNLSDFTASVACTRTPASGTLSDGAASLAFYQIVATACNAPVGGACPATGTLQATYVERQLTRTLSR